MCTYTAYAAEMPNRPATQHRSVRVPDDRWTAAADSTAALGMDRATYINLCLAWLNHEPGVKRPQRPPAPQPPSDGDA